MYTHADRGGLVPRLKDWPKTTMQRGTQLVFHVCMCVCVAHTCLVFMGWQAIPEQGVQHVDKWDKIERVPARAYKLDPASWKKKGARRIDAHKGDGPQSDTGGSLFLCSQCFTQASTRARVQTRSPKLTNWLRCTDTHTLAYRITHSSIAMYYPEPMAFLKHSMFK